MSAEFAALMATTQLEREKADGIKSLVAASKLAAKYEAERDAALARNERQRATLAKIRAIVADPAAFGVVADIRAALEPTEPKGKP